jgi:dephospho-CoA kinase
MPISMISRFNKYRAKFPPRGPVYGHYLTPERELGTRSRKGRVTARKYRVRVKRIAVTGGIGAGKTAVTDRLVSLGFSVVDADVAARHVVENGQPAWRALRDAFGTAVLTPEGNIDRKFLADVVFHDTSALRRLNHITHGYIGEELEAGVRAATGEVVFVAIPLFRTEHRTQLGLDEVWAVLASPDTEIHRLTTLRGFDADDARARLGSQRSNDELAALADRVLWNEGTLEELYGQVDEALGDLVSL